MKDNNVKSDHERKKFVSLLKKMMFWKGKKKINTKFIAKELFPYNFRLRKCREEDKVPLTN